MLVADNRADQLETLRFGKNQERLAGKWTLEGLLHSNQLLRVFALHQFRRGLACYDLDGRDRQQDLLAHHMSETARGAADTHVGDFGERILFDLGEFACLDSHVANFFSRSAAPERNAARPSSVKGFGIKPAFNSRARPTISFCTFAETTARGMFGWLVRIFATNSSPSIPGMLKSISAISTMPSETAASASSALAVSTRVHSGRIRRNALAITIRASLLSSTIKTLYCIFQASLS